MKAEIRELLDRKEAAQDELAEVNSMLAEAILKYEGTLVEALQDGIIRLNFAAPRGFMQHIRGKRDRY